MTQEPRATLTRKGEQTRAHILSTALALFASKGYAETTMRDIATAADSSLGLTYRYFASKEALVLALYTQLAEEFERQVEALPPAPMAERFERAMKNKFILIEPYEDAIGAFLGAALTPKSTVAVLGHETTEIRHRVALIFQGLVRGATDAPKAPQSREISTIFHAMHMVFLLFWVNDRTPGRRATHNLLGLARDTIGLLRPILWLPPVAGVLTRLVGAIGPMFEPDDNTEDSHEA